MRIFDNSPLLIFISVFYIFIGVLLIFVHKEATTRWMTYRWEHTPEGLEPLLDYFDNIYMCPEPSVVFRHLPSDVVIPKATHWFLGCHKDRYLSTICIQNQLVRYVGDIICSTTVMQIIPGFIWRSCPEKLGPTLKWNWKLVWLISVLGWVQTCLC